MVAIARALPEDLPPIVAMEQATDTNHFIMAYSLEEHIRKMSEPDVVYLRITKGDTLVGFFILALDPDGISIEFRRIVVSIKGQGIGQIAIGQMEQFCHTELCRSRIWLDVFETNARGRHIYEKLGYQKFGSTLYQGSTLFLYEKWL